MSDLFTPSPARPPFPVRRASRALAVLLAAALVVGAPALGMAAPATAPETPSTPACTGTDLMTTLSPDQRATIAAAVADTPYARGTRFTATRGSARIEIVGTYHFDDPRHADMIDAVSPLIAEAGALLVEAGPDEERRLTRAMAEDPTLMVDPTGPTLPERLSTAEWDELSAALKDRGLPAIMASKMRPWYVAMMLGISPCMLQQIKSAGDTGGLDHRLIDVARAAGTPIRALEPWDTVFSLFDGMTPGEELDMIRAALPAARRADDYAVTTIEAYFRGDIWAIWEFNRLDAHATSGLDPAEVDRQVALAEERLMVARNRSWIAPLTRTATEAAAVGKPVVAAFGALHLPGDQGVLKLLENDGWTITKGP